MTAPLTTGQLVTTTFLNELERRKPTNAKVATSQTTASTTYVDLTTVGPAVTVTTGTSALVTLRCQLENNTAGAFSAMSVAVSGATTVAAGDDPSITFVSATAAQALQTSVTFLITGLTAGSNTFTAKYRVGSGTGTFQRRELVVIPFD